MRRREFITLAGGILVSWPYHGYGRNRAPMPLVCGLMLPTLSTRLLLVEGLRLGFEQNGLVVGGNLAFEMRSADGRRDRLAEIILRLLADKPDVIVTWGTEPVQAVLAQTHLVPIVMASIGDPIGAGVVSNLARPGGNVTGFSLFLPETTGKRLELLKQMLPRLQSVTFLRNPDNKSVELQFLATVSDAKILGIEVQSGFARRPEEIDEVIKTSIKGGSGAIIASDDQLFTSQRIRIVDAAMRVRIPVVSSLREFTDAGGLFTFGTSITDTSRRAAGYVNKILKGTKPGDLPVEQPTKFELIINLKTANRLGIDVPPTILALADDVIE
jgi:putative ABC transport system substrate-binding protein